MVFSTHQLLAENNPDLCLQDGSISCIRHQVLERVADIRAFLESGKLQRVAIHADNSVAWVLLDLACMEAGVLLLPLPMNFTADQISHALDSCGIEAIFTALPAMLPDDFEAASQTVLPEVHLLTRTVAQLPELPEATAKVTFTSGSTGRPKGVCLGLEQQLATAQALCETIGLQSPRHLCVLPLSTLLENIAGIYAPLLAGGTVILRSLSKLGYEGSRLADPYAFLRCISEARPDSIILIPQLLHVLVQAVRQGWQKPELKFIAVGGSRVSPQLVQEARDLGLPVYEGYGLSECASVVSLNTPGNDRQGSAGKVLPHVTVKDAAGELMIEGNLMLGYVHEQSSWYPTSLATGDLGSIDKEGFLHLSGRRSNVLISSYGRNISPEWVESELLASPLLAEVVVFGDARPYCIALVTPRMAGVPEAAIQQVIDAANRRLPDYARVLDWIQLQVPLSATPGLVTANGRPCRKEISRQYASAISQLYERTALAGAGN